MPVGAADNIAWWPIPASRVSATRYERCGCRIRACELAGQDLRHAIFFETTTMNSPIPMHLFTGAAAGGAGAMPQDIDPEETAEWHEAFESLIAAHGRERAAFMLDELC